MTTINSYLTFSGNCREAMTFYRDCLGGDLTLQTIGESPLSDKMPAQMKACILHAMLKSGPLVLMASDMVPEEGLVRGNGISMCVNCSSEEEITVLYKKLSDGGRSTHSLETTFWGATLGNV